MTLNLVHAVFTWSWPLAFEIIRYRIIPRTATLLRYFKADNCLTAHYARNARSVLQIVGRHPTGFA